MTFKQWLSEWEGFQFNPAKNFTNSAQPYSGIRSRFQTPEEDPEDDKELGNIDRPRKLFGMKPDDEILKMKMKKRMRKQ